MDLLEKAEAPQSILLTILALFFFMSVLVSSDYYKRIQ